ncbi:MAG: hypothetical protein KIS96_11625 [Bauldia sp.]|nr:hypothetical protein [Bauldia sp.]
MTFGKTHDGGRDIKSAFAGYSSATAGSTGDATEVDGPYIDRKDADGGMAMWAKLVITYRTVLAATKTLSVAANLQDDADGQGAGNDYGDALAATVQATGESGGSTETGTVELDFDLAGAERYIRAQFTPDLNAANTDTAILTATLILGGFQYNPVSGAQN